MTPEVVELLRSLSANIEPFPRVALLSPGPQERKLFPKATVLRRDDWDLNQKRRDLRFDLIIACHVFHYSSEPSRWFENVGASCRALLITDLIRRKRSAEGELGQDGDSIRYAVDEHRPSVPRFFELNSLGERLLARHVYPGATNEYGPALHFLALIRGELEGPLVHLGGYPSVEASEALTRLHSLIEEFETRSVPAYLGVAPTRLQPAMVEHLRQLRCVRPTLHQHEPARGLFSRSPLPFWAGTQQIREQLGDLHSRLQEQLAQKVSTYLAERRVNRRTARALAGLGFDLCLSERGSRRAELPSLRFDFSGPSSSYPRGRALEAVGLNLALEGKLPESGLHAMFEAIEEQRRASKNRVGALTTRIAAL